MRHASGREGGGTKRCATTSVSTSVGKDAHWACVLDAEGEMILSRRVEATAGALEAAREEIAALGIADERVVGIDLAGGPAALLEAD
jgi:hypothetical protein